MVYLSDSTVCLWITPKLPNQITDNFHKACSDIARGHIRLLQFSFL